MRGAAPGTRETELLAPINTVDKVHAILLAGGSAFGLDAAGGVMRWLDERGIGIPFGPIRADGRQATVPIVPAAILFDLSIGDSSIRPDAAAGYAACAAATRDAPAEGNVGAGAGAMIGKLFGIERAMRGGLGTASITVDGITVAALVAVNAMGDVVDPATGRIVAGARSRRRQAACSARCAAFRRGEWPPPLPPARRQPASATTLAIVATDAVIEQGRGDQDRRRWRTTAWRARIRPVHTMSDGDIVFALGTGASGRRRPPPCSAPSPPTCSPKRCCARSAPRRRCTVPACRTCRRRAICRRAAG